MYLFFDTETTGLPRDWNSPITDTDNWPRLVQIAWLVYDVSGKRISSRCALIKPEGFVIPEAATRVHGITTAKAHKHGEDLHAILDLFMADIHKARMLIAHNIQFDTSIVGAELVRAQKGSLPDIQRLCTMKQTAAFCKLPNPSHPGFKWPNLAELHTAVFGMRPQLSHDALADAQACAECFFELRRQGYPLEPVVSPKKPPQSL